MRLIGLAVVLALSLMLAPFAADTQQAGKIYRIGILAIYPVGPFFRDPFVARLRELDYVEGQNLVLEIRSANNIPERLPALAVELVRLNVDVIVTGGDSEVRAARQATRTIPIVMAPSGDPVRAGYVASLARPGGNITGVSWMSPERSAKLLEVLKDAVPKMSRIAVLWNSANPVKVIDFGETQRAAQVVGYYTDRPDLVRAGVRKVEWQSDAQAKRRAEMLALRAAFLDWFVEEWVREGGVREDGVHQILRYPLR